MKYSIHYTALAEGDLREIVEYLAAKNLSAAVRWLAEIEQLFALLVSQPELGERMQTRRFGEVRRQSAGNYSVYYRLVDDTLQILRVLHAARDQGALL